MAAVTAVTVLSLVTGLVTFVAVTKAGGDEPGTSASADPQPSASTPARTPTRSPAERVTANGQLLRAPAPLDKIRLDQGSTIKLPDGRLLWIFADTFQRTTGKPRFFVTSAAAIADPFSFRLSWSRRHAGTGVPVEFLPRKADEKRGSQAGVTYKAVWPTGSTLLPDGRVIISYAKYQVLLESHDFVFLGGGLYEFRYSDAKRFRHGAQAKRIADDIWTPYDGEVKSPIYADGYVYFQQCANLVCFALRTTPAELRNKASYRWWTGSGWSADRADRAQVTVATNHPGGNASVVRLRSGVYAMADTEAGAPSPYGQLWVAPNPWGPWSRAASTILPGCPKGCYGLNLHPVLSTSNVLRLSYSTVGGPYVRVVDVPVSISASGTSISTR